MADQELDRTADEEVQEGQSTSGQESRQPDRRQGEEKPLNLDDIPEFRKFRSNADKRIAQERAAREASERRIADMERALEQMRTADMDDVQKLQYELEKERRRAMEAQQAFIDLQRYSEWQNDMRDIANEVGVPQDVLQDAWEEGEIKSAHDAWKVANRWVKQSQAKQSKSASSDRNRKVEDDPSDVVDLGESRTPNEREKLQRKYEQAVESGDLFEVMAAEEAALKAGVRLKHM